MNSRTVIRFSGALLALLFASCDNYTPFEPGAPLELAIVLKDAAGQDSIGTPRPLGIEMDQGDAIQLTALLGGQPVQVNWSSTDESVATVSPTGLVSWVGGGTAAITATLVSDPSRQRSASITAVPADPERLLRRTGLSDDGPRGSEQVFEVEIEAGVTNFTVTLTGGTGDVDLYLVSPSDVLACASFNDGNEESCSIDNPEPGTWTIILDLWNPYQGVTLEARASSDPDRLLRRTGLSDDGPRGSEQVFEIEVPDAVTKLTVTLSGGTGDVDLYLFDPSDELMCSSFNDGNEESCSIDDPEPGTWTIILDLWNPYEGVTLEARVTR